MSTSSAPSSISPRKCNNIPSPHGPLSVRKLLSLKITDKRSCYVTGLHKDIATEKTLEQYQYFGQFGDILSIRIIQNTNPMCAYVRFKDEKSAKSAILWCNNLTTKMIAGEHGYHRYCIKFINHKTCKKLNCANRHTWCNSNDYIIVKNKTYKASDKNIPFYSSKKVPKPKSTQTKTKTKTKVAQNKSCSTEEMEVLQSQFNVLQCQYNQQNHFIKSLLQQLQQLRTENQSLKRDYSGMSQYLEMAKYKQRNANANANTNANALPAQATNNSLPNEFEIHAIVDSIIKDEFQGQISSISDTPSLN